MTRYLRAWLREASLVQSPVAALMPKRMPAVLRRSSAALGATALALLSWAGAAAASAPAAMVSLPPSAGRVVNVEERGFGRTLQQRVVLSGGHAGANTIEIAFGAPAPSSQQLASELEARFPGVVMTPLSGRMLKSPYGAMHVAIGAPDAGGRCLFAWQRVDDVARTDGRPRGMFQRSTPAVVRIRMCSARATLDELAAMSEQVVIGAPGSLDPALGGARSVADAPVAPIVPPARLAPVSSYADRAPAAPRVQLAQASGGALLERRAGNPGGLIGLMRGYGRDEPVQRQRPAARAPRAATSYDYDNHEAQPLVQQAGLLDGWLARRRMEMQRRSRGAKSAPRAVRPAPARKSAPRPAARPKAAPARRAAPAQRRAAPPRATRSQSRPQVMEQPALQTHNQPAAPQGYQGQGYQGQGYQAQGNGARYLGPTPGAIPINPAPSGGQALRGGGADSAAAPLVPRPVQGGAATPPAAGAQRGVSGGQQPLRGLDPSLPGRAYRGPGG